MMPVRTRLGLACALLLGAALLTACSRSEPPTKGGPVTVRRLTEAQYRNVIADVFGPQIVVAGRFDPIVRTEGLLAVGASRASITPSGVERFAALARSIAQQVVAPGNRELLIPCRPAAPGAADDACATKFFQQAGRLLYRRAVTADDLAGPVRIARTAALARQDFHAGLAYGLQGMLTSPEFLFIAESAEPDPADKNLLRLDAYSRASRLSFMLWNTTPDAMLLDAAARGELADADGVAAQVDRLMASPRFTQGVRAFFTDMLSLDDFSTLEKDSLIYPAFGLAAAEDSREQVLRTLIDELIAREGDYRDIFTTRRTFMTVPLGMVYRVPATRPGGWAPFEFEEGDPRAGIQTQLSFVALHSHPGKSSPTLRGKAIRELLLCQKVPDPPGNVNFDRFNDPKSPNKTARLRLAAHATDPACAGCHKLMDPIGLALENFDGAGQIRLTENGERIDASGELNGFKFADARGLGQAMREDPAATSCVVRRAYTYAAGRPIEKGERDWMADLEQSFADDGYRLRPLLRRIALSKALQSIAKPKPELSAGGPT